MPDDTPWMNDPDFKNLPLPEKHKFLLQADPDYKGLPAKEQAKALDAIHYGTLGQISGEGISLKGAGTAAWNTVKGMVPPAPQGPVLSKQFWIGSPSFEPEKGGIAQAGREAAHEYQRSTQAGSNPLAAAASAGVVGTGNLATGLSNIEQEKMAEQGEGGQIIGQSAVPVTMAAAAPLLEGPLGKIAAQRRGIATPVTNATAPPVFDVGVADWALSPKKALLKYGVNKAAELLGRKGGSATPSTPFPGATSTAPGAIPSAPETVSIAGTPVRTTPFAELPPAPKGEPTPFPRVMTKAELRAQARAEAAAAKEAAKPKPRSPFEGATSSSNVGKGSFVPQESRNLTPFQPVTQGPITGTGPLGEVQGIQGITPPPRQVATPPPAAEGLVAQPGQPTSLLSRGRTVVQPGMEPDMNNPTHVKMINDYQTMSGPALRQLAQAGDRFAAFVLRHMPRP